MHNEWHTEEYRQLRYETVSRVQLLHQIIALASALLFLSILGGIWVWNQYGAHLQLATYALLLPLVFAGLTFNYQANQMTMEAVARYIQRKYNEHLRWDDDYSNQKIPNRLTSFLKVTPLLAPLLIPIMVQATLPLTSELTSLAAVDITLLGLVIFNFRYKL